MATQQQQQEAVVITMGDLNLNTTESQATSSSASKKKQDTLFGPNIGIVARGPEWTETREKAIDELTPDVVRGWIAKSKEGNQSTTTLQALVNLKRPTLRLTPLEPESDELIDHVESQHQHALEFEYDCDAPKCGITVHIVLSSSHHLAEKTTSGQSKVLVYEAVTDGGFGHTLKLEDGATLELGRYEHVRRPPNSPAFDELKLKAESSSSAVETEPVSGTQTPNPEEEAGRKKRFTAFHFRKRTTQERSVAGPALAVLDAEVKEDTKEDDKEDENNVGVKAIIKLCALDSTGKPLMCINEQSTYLHIVRFGAPPPPEEQDRRPWVVKVVKREATIGAHTFHLHEIYGLSSSASNTGSTPPPAAPPTTYPPTNTPAPQYEEEPSSECLLCLSAPREVVLLPCRHLVACRDCAMNMIEFGAGGQITQPNEPTGATEGEVAEGGEGGVAAQEGDAGSPPAAPVAPALPTPTTRRRRKAKGWFCPVCRQPYTSCLRITTTPPSKDMIEDEHIESVRTIEHPLAPVPAPPAPVAAPTVNRGGLASLVRPGFLRGFSRHSGQAPDLERGQAVAAA